MIDKIATHIARTQTKRPWVFIITFIAVIAAAIPGIFLLVGNVQASLEQVLPPTVESVDAMNDARTQYSADMLHVAVYADAQLADITHAHEYIEEVAQRIRSIPSVTAVHTGSAQWHVNADKTLAVIDVQADTGADTERITETITEIEQAIDASEASNPGVRTQITGFAAIDKATFSTIMSDFLRITAVAMLLIILIVYAVLRNLKHVAIAMSTVFSALLMTMGITGYLGITVTVVTMVAAAMILGLGIDFGIHTMHTYAHYHKQHETNTATIKTLQELFRAQLAASMTTSAGFLALGLGVLPAMADLGVMLALGVMTTFVAATLLLPAIITLSHS